MLLSMEFDFVPFELGRMFLGEASLWFLLEIVVRVIIVYVYTILLLRLLGNAGMRNMNFLDYFLVISLGSASGDIMMYPSVPIIYCLVAITVAIGLKKLISMLNIKSELVNEAIQADPVRVIYQGKLDEEMLARKDMRKDTFFTMLRIQGIQDTGRVERCYLEPNGAISVFELESDREWYHGEATIPPEDLEGER